jgi:H-NS histone family protein
VAEWEYRKIGLNQHGPRGDELDLLNAAGGEGWELIAITSNSIAYLKRELEELGRARSAESGISLQQDENANGHDVAGVRTEVKVKYRDPVTNETWTGRGRMATWLKKKQDAGEDINKYLVDRDIE